MRRRRALEEGGGFINDLDRKTSSNKANITQRLSTAGICLVLVLATILNRYVYQLHIGDNSTSMPLHIGDFIDVQLPILSGSKIVDDIVCPGRILSSNISSFLVLAAGHALEGAQWMPRERVIRHTQISSKSHPEACTLSNAAVSATDAGVVGDGCSRFIQNFCSHEWERHPRTRHFSSFDCLYPVITSDTDLSLSSWFLAQSIGKSRGVCPDPVSVLWPPSKITYSRCSDAIRSHAFETGHSLAAHFDFPESSDALIQHQRSAFLTDLCPSPDLFRWVPDATLWPHCETWIRNKCAPGTACSISETQQWSSDIIQRKFADAQNWCAGRGKCPGSLEGRWRPGALFYPDCSHYMAIWCQDNGVLGECNHITQPVRGNQAQSDRPKRIQAQAWAHMTQENACPDPYGEFVWNGDVAVQHGRG